MEETKTMKTPMSSSISLIRMRKEDCRLGFQIWVAFSSSHASQLALALISLHFWHTQGFSCDPLSLYHHYSFLARVFSSTWLLDESSLSLRHKASAQLSCLNRRHAKRATYGMGGLSFLLLRELRFVWTRRAVGLRVYESKIWPTMRDLSLERVFKDVGGNLTRETDFEVPNTYDTYDDQSMGKMKFEKAWDGSWAPLASNHAPWMDLSTQISSLGTCIEELTVRIEHIEDHLEHQHEEMMAHLLFVFPPPPPQP
ncbi:hypothetical protein CK203_093877 [Vitis vinifera]|uniref:Uncharacterized protein n=1 Tax=Vitis vinifera TaxID=29760 RepID=A0A438C7E8_VITVI|nr:hypothetical protein CK203_093877 [Vitis vinifera]